jgi:hypothetical protein
VTDLLQIISRLESSGGTLTLDWDRVRYRIPPGNPLASSLLDQLRQRREGLAEVLRARGKGLAPCGRPDCAGCYGIGDGGDLHPPKVSVDWLEWLQKWEPGSSKVQ